jgi:hypothetical protein
MAERMAVELIVFVDVDDDITEEEMDHKADDLAQGIANDTGCGVSKPTAWLVEQYQPRGF